MALLLPLTDAALADCRSHIDQYRNIDPVIIAYLTRHVNGLMCTEIETVVTSLISDRLQSGCNDEATLHFVKAMKVNAVRNAKVREIRNTLGRLGSDYGERFTNLVECSVGEEGISKLGIAVGKRNANAHKDPPDITFGELEEAYDVATLVVDAIRLTLRCQTS